MGGGGSLGGGGSPKGEEGGKALELEGRGPRGLGGGPSLQEKLHDMHFF